MDTVFNETEMVTWTHVSGSACMISFGSMSCHKYHNWLTKDTTILYGQASDEPTLILSNSWYLRPFMKSLPSCRDLDLNLTPFLLVVVFFPGLHFVLPYVPSHSQRLPHGLDFIE